MPAYRAAMSVKTAIVNPAEWMAQVSDLIVANWAETGFDFPFDPDVATYERLASIGMMFAVAAFDGEHIIGYCTVLVAKHMHNRAMTMASNDALFVAPEYRKGLTAAKIMLAAEAEAARRGASRFTWHCRAGTDLADTLIRHGYEPVDNVVMKGL